MKAPRLLTSSRVSCPAENTWIAYVGGELEAAALDGLDAHLDTCPTCRELYVNIARDDGRAPTQAAGASRRPLGTTRDLPRGTPVGRYLVLSSIGRGGMGVVYKAYDPELERAIALKLVAFDGLGGPGAEPLRQRLLREAKTLAQVSHPNVVTVHDVGTFEGSLFVAMEFIAGQNLRRWLHAAPRSPREILSVFAAAGAGLAAAHEHGIVHRDFKPENVMVGDDGRVRVLDFGLASSASAGMPVRPSLADLAPDNESAPLTRDGSVLGTPTYMAPEQDAGRDVDARSDQFSFCASLYEALFGQRPFSGTTYLEMATRRATGEVEPPPAVRGVRARVRVAVLRGLRSAPAERHRDMRALLAELRKRPWYANTRVAAGALVPAALAATGWAVWTTHHAPPTAEETCASAGDEIDRVWNADRKHALEHQMIATGHPRARLIASHVEKALDEWAQQWVKERAAVCEATLRGEDNAGSRVECLQRQRGSIEGMLMVLTGPLQPDRVLHADEWAASLPEPVGCHRADDDSAGPSKKKDATDQAVSDALQQAQIAGHRGDYAQAIEHARAGAKLAHGVSDAAEATALMTALAWQIVAGHYVEAADTVRDDLFAASRLTLDDFVLDAWIYDIRLSLAGSRLDWHVEQAIFAAELSLEHAEPDEPLRATLPFLIGKVRTMQGDFDEADRQLHAAQVTLQKVGDHHGAGDFRVTHPDAIESSLAYLAMFRGQLADAHRVFERALESSQGRPPDANRAWTQEHLANTLDYELRHDEARAMYERALQGAEAMPGQNEVLVTQLRVALAWHDIFGGVCDATGHDLARAEPVYAMAYGRDSAAFATIWAGQGACALWAHDAARATELLERARKLIGDHPVSPVQLVGTEMLLSHAYRRHGDIRQADEVAASVRGRLAKVPGARAFYEELDARLAARPR